MVIWYLKPMHGPNASRAIMRRVEGSISASRATLPQA